MDLEQNYIALTAKLSNYYQALCKEFDSKEDITCLFSINLTNIQLNTESYQEFNEWVKLLCEFAKKKSYKLAYNELSQVLTIFGRFFLLLLSRKDCTNDLIIAKKECSSVILITLTNYPWKIEQYPLLKICILNLLLFIGCDNADDAMSFIKENLCINSKEVFENPILNQVMQAIDIYIGYLKESPKPIDLSNTWHYCYIFKKKFGFIFMKNIVRISCGEYKYNAIAISPSFKNFQRSVGSPSKALVVYKSEQRRSSEYKEPERFWCYNWTTMQFE